MPACMAVALGGDHPHACMHTCTLRTALVPRATHSIVSVLESHGMGGASPAWLLARFLHNRYRPFHRMAFSCNLAAGRLAWLRRLFFCGCSSSIVHQPPELVRDRNRYDSLLHTNVDAKRTVPPLRMHSACKEPSSQLIFRCQKMLYASLFIATCFAQ